MLLPHRYQKAHYRKNSKTTKLTGALTGTTARTVKTVIAVRFFFFQPEGHIAASWVTTASVSACPCCWRKNHYHVHPSNHVAGHWLFYVPVGEILSNGSVSSWRNARSQWSTTNTNSCRCVENIKVQCGKNTKWTRWHTVGLFSIGQAGVWLWHSLEPFPRNHTNLITGTRCITENIKL